MKRPQCGDRDYVRCPECQASRYESHLEPCALRPRLDPACESCGRRGRPMVTATIGGEQHALCESCGHEARDNGCEVVS